MFNTGEVRRNGYMNSGLDTVQQRLHEASDARAVEITKGEYPISGNVDLTHSAMKILPKYLPTCTAKA